MKKYIISIFLAFFLCIQWGCVYQNNDAVIICFGDSSTAGAEEPTYPQLLADKLGVPRNKVANEGNSGETARMGLDRLTNIIDSNKYPNANTLIYWEGGNEISDFIKEYDHLLEYNPCEENYPLQTKLAPVLEGIGEDVFAAIQIAKSKGWRVIVVGYYSLEEEDIVILECDASSLTRMTSEMAKNANAYHNMLSLFTYMFANQTGASFVDLNNSAVKDVLQSDLRYWHDCTHLSGAGNDVVADFILDSVDY